MDDWRKFDETSLPEKKISIVTDLNMEDITDADYAHAQRVCKSLAIKSLGEYHDLRVLKYMNLTRLVFLLQQELA